MSLRCVLLLQRDKRREFYSLYYTIGTPKNTFRFSIIRCLSMQLICIFELFGQKLVYIGMPAGATARLLAPYRPPRC